VKGLIKRMEKVESSAETAQYITNKIIEEGLVRDPRIKAANLVMVGVQPAKFRQVEVNAQEFNGHDSDTVDDLDELFPNVTDGNRPQVARDHLITPLTNRQRELYRFLESIRPTASLAHGYLNKIRHGLERGDFAQANRVLDEPLDVPTKYTEAGDYMPN
ncbi:hypothetical protein KY308_02460, partial [Candidatus Woesearchaeota archaeon]|nr:hypothetical protein [Candidatus Woesearchaeota archaeon]